MSYTGELKRIIEAAWQDAKEEDLLTILSESYEDMGYETYSVHKNRAGSERGIDLTVRNQEHTIIFQLKVRPRKADVDQLKEFSSQPADKRVYIYLKDPTRPFKDEMDPLRDKVEFWDIFRLHEELIKLHSASYLHRLFSNLSLVRKIRDTLLILYENRNIAKGELTDTTTLKLLWRMKDETVKLTGTMRLLHEQWRRILTELIPEREEELVKTLHEVLRHLFYIDMICGTSLYQAWRRAGAERPYLFTVYWLKVRNRSRWYLLCGGMEGARSEEERREVITNYMLGYQHELPADLFTAVMILLENLKLLAEDLEYGVDEVFDYLKNQIAKRLKKVG